MPGEASCTDCHRGSGGTGNVTVSFGGGSTYTPGTKQHLVVTITDAAQRRWGFQVTARQAASSGTQVGTFTPGTDGYTQLVCAPANFRGQAFGNSCSNNGMPLQYIEHTQAGTRNGTTGSGTFAFDWTPPAAGTGNVVVYVAALAANGDNSSNGDHTYTAKYTLTPAGSSTPAPAITAGGVVNAASFQPSVSAGSWVTIQGSNLAGTTRSWGASDIVNGALPTRLDGVSATINGKAAFVAYVSPTQINVQAPADAAQGPVPVDVTFNGNTSAAGAVQLQPVSPAFFLWSGKYAVATRADYSLVGPAGLFAGATTAPAKAGDVIILWGTGFGATTPAVAPGVVPPSATVANVANAVTVTIGNLPAQVLGAAIAPGNAGLYQVAVKVPAGVASGDQAVIATVSGIASAGGTYLTVSQ